MKFTQPGAALRAACTKGTTADNKMRIPTSNYFNEILKNLPREEINILDAVI